MNMYKIYLKQAWALIRQEQLFSSVYIVGTGLAISLVMVLFAAIRERCAGLREIPATPLAVVADREERHAEG
jgi:Na+-translocating ferredoxin:NAD+ oxidoreductase RnfA subunit